MAIGLIAQIGIGIVSSIVQYMASSASKGTDASNTTSQDTPSSKVSISDAATALKKNAETSSVAKSPVDSLFSNASDAVRQAWEKTKEGLGLDTGNKDYYANQMAIMAMMAQSASMPGGGVNNPSDFFGTSVDSAIEAVDKIIGRLNTTIPGYDSNSRDRLAALEMYSTFKQNLINMSSATVQV